MKKVFTFMFTIGLVLGLTACGSDSTTATPERQAEGILGTQLQPEVSKPGPFIGEKAGQFGEIDVSTDEGYQKLVKAVQDGALFLDVRNEYERDNDYYAAGSVSGAIYEFRPDNKRVNPEFITAVNSIVKSDKNRQIIIICNSASRTLKASKWLSSKTWRDYQGGEFNNVYHVVGGMEAWASANRPMGDNPLN